MNGSDLHPQPSFFVRPVFYGGPLDGWAGLLVEGDRVRGSVKHRGGTYSLQGFKSPTGDYEADDAVYEWVPAK
jgi:hypothetical protein